MRKRLTCPNCGRFFGFEDIKRGKVELLCPNCKKWLIIIAREEKNARNTIKRDRPCGLDGKN